MTGHRRGRIRIGPRRCPRPRKACWRPWWTGLISTSLIRELDEAIRSRLAAVTVEGNLASGVDARGAEGIVGRGGHFASQFGRGPFPGIRRAERSGWSLVGHVVEVLASLALTVSPASGRER